MEDDYEYDDMDDAELEREIFRLRNEVDADPSPDPSPVYRGPSVPQSSASPGKEVEELRRALKAKDEELMRYKNIISSGTGGTVEAIRDAKYLDALKKAKALTVKLEKEKSTTNKLTRQLVDLEKKVLHYEEMNILPSACGASELASVLPGSEDDMIKQLKDNKAKISQISKQLAEMRRQNQDLMADAKRMKEVLKRETGEENFDKLMEDGSGWRGRAQTISLLKSKIKALQREKQNGPGGDGDDGMTSERSAFSMAPSVNRDSEDVQRANLDRIRDDKQKQILELTGKLVAKESEANQLKEKNEALTARTHILEKSNADLKVKIHRVIEKTENDDRLLEMYKNEIETLKRSGPQQAPRVRTPPIARPLSAETAEMVQSLKAELATTKQKLMDALYNSVQKDSNASHEGESDERLSLRLRFAEVEVEKFRELVTLLRDQLSAESDRHTSTSKDLRQERQKTMSLEKTLAKEKGAIQVQPKQGLEEKVAMFRDENRSLKEQMAVCMQAKDSEIGSLKALLREQKYIMESAGPLVAGDGERGPDIKSSEFQELEELRWKFKELTKAYNTLQMRAMKG